MTDENTGDSGAEVQLYTQNDTGEYVEYQAPEPPSFRDTLPEQFREHEYFKGVENIEQLAEGFKSTKDNLPVVPENYEFEFPEGFSVDEETLNGFRQAAKEVGITQSQFEKIMGFEIERNQKMAEAMKNDVRSHRQEAEEKLKADWGEGYEKNLETAKRTINVYGNEDFNNWLEDTKLGDSPQMIRLLNWVGSKLGEDALIDSSKRPPKEGEKDISGKPMLSFPSMEQKK